LLRTIHLVAIAGVGGAFFTSSVNDFSFYILILYASGFLFVFLEIWSDGVWLIQLRGIIIYLKLFFLLLLFLFPGNEKVIIILLIAISGIISHAPANVRYYSIFHGKKITTMR